MLQQATAYEGFIFETFILASVAIIALLILVKYYQKGKNYMAKLLFFVFLNWTLAVFFSWLAKIMSAFFEMDTDPPFPPVDLVTLLARYVLDFRLLFVFASLALYLSYMLRVQLFDKTYNKGERAINTILVILAPVLSLSLPLQNSDMIGTIITFAVMFLFMLIVYSPFMKRAYETYKEVDQKYKGAFASLTVMALFFILSFLCFLLDQLVVAITEQGFSVFYFAAWICASLGNLFTYFGYIKPRTGN